MSSHTELIQDIPRMSRRKFRLSIKVLMILVALAGVGLGLFSRWYESHTTIHRRIPGGKFRAQPKLIDLFVTPTDGDLLRRAFRIDLEGQSVDDATLAGVLREANPGGLSLIDTRITDAGLVHVGKMTRLEFLDLGRTEITDLGLVHLTHLKGLRGLSVKETKVSRRGLDDLLRFLPNGITTYGPGDGK